MSVFVHYAEPKLDKKQSQIVRSQAMVSFRRQQKQAKFWDIADSTARGLNSRRTIRTEVSDQDAVQQEATRLDRSQPKRSRRPAADAVVTRPGPQLAAHHLPLNPYDLRGAPPQSTHMTGIDARTFQDYVCQCGAYSTYLDDAFVLVGFRLPSYFRPDMSKAACIYIGWLLTVGVLDAAKGSREISYPYYEYQAVRELQKFIDSADNRDLHEVVYPVIILAMFEMVRFNPRAKTHLAAVECFIKSRGGLKRMPDVMQHIVIMGDVLQSVCLRTPLAFNTLGHAPTMRLTTSCGIYRGDHLLSSPFLQCDGESFSFVAKHVDPAIAGQLAGVLQAASTSLLQFFDSGADSSPQGFKKATDLDEIADNMNPTTDTPGLLLQMCTLASRIMRRTISGTLDGLDSATNRLDVLKIYANARFVPLRAWAGLPYIYVWVNLIGLGASHNERMRSYFIAEIVRCAFSYGCYQMEIFNTVLKNFLHLRNVVLSSRINTAVAE